MTPRFRSLLAHWWAPSTGIARRISAERPHYRQARLESCEERAVLSANGTDFVTALYSDILNRAPDQAGLANYNSLLQSGASPASVAGSIWDSAEHRGVQIDGFYQTLLHRAADSEGRQAWIDKMVGGMSEETVMLGFVTSVEYLQHNPLDPLKDVTTYVTALYHDILGRSPDAKGLFTWTSHMYATQIVSQTPWSDTDVAAAFIDSQERHLHLVDSYYANFDQRAADPAGEANYAQMLDQGQANDETVALAFLSSAEYINHHPLTPLS